jgi:hypothetical protein
VILPPLVFPGRAHIGALSGSHFVDVVELLVVHTVGLKVPIMQDQIRAYGRVHTEAFSGSHRLG